VKIILCSAPGLRLQNYRVGLDYAHSQVHFEIGRTFNFPDFDVVGLVLRPEDDGRFTILGAIDSPDRLLQADGVAVLDHLIAVDQIPVAGSTMGQVWSMLGGTPGQQRKLTVERAGKQLTVVAKVRHFLAESEDDPGEKKKKK
jgi:C-terminal processing protease CtpA/Prc